ncbi:uncharacterized protein LOC143465765 [Clavelina lepadiformis]|uniref:uncharacterized protein LOC143465765 n=1 Tax=Clavelina lepadiformis TaxID=159417 RepID=UPI004040FE4D
MATFNQGLCGCFDNSSLCILTFCAFPFVVGKNAESVKENPVLWAIGYQMAPCIVGGYLRSLVRKQSGIDGSFGNDCCMHCLFPCCAVTQEAAQTKACHYLFPAEGQVVERTPAA